MSQPTIPDAYARQIAPATVKIQRLLPGPIERVWAYLTEGDLRRQWLAAGSMELAVGASFELVWRNDELTSPPGRRPADFQVEHRMRSVITECDPPRRLAFTWHEDGGVTFELEPQGGEVLLTVVHRRLPDHETTLMVGAGWHMHLDVLAARLAGKEPEPYWDGWTRLRDEYAGRFSG